MNIKLYNSQLDMASLRIGKKYMNRVLMQPTYRSMCHIISLRGTKKYHMISKEPHRNEPKLFSLDDAIHVRFYLINITTLTQKNLPRIYEWCSFRICHPIQPISTCHPIMKLGMNKNLKEQKHKIRSPHTMTNTKMIESLTL